MNEAGPSVDAPATLEPDFGPVTLLPPRPISPSTQSLPILRGSAPLGTQRVIFSAYPSCLGEIGAGTLSEFAGSGVIISVRTNSSTAIYARGYADSDTPTSPCSLLMNYVHDTVAPTATLTSPLDGAVIHSGNAGQFTFSGTCSDPGLLVSLQGPASGAGICSPTRTFSFPVDLRSLLEGTHLFRVYLIDLAGNQGNSAWVTLSKDTLPPEVVIRSPEKDSRIGLSQQTAFLMSGLCSEEGRPVTLSGSLTGSTTCASGEWSFSLNLTPLVDGPFTLTVNQSDLASNSASDSRTFTKDTTPPSVSFTSPLAGAILNADQVSNVTVSGNCSEEMRPILIGDDWTTRTTCSGGIWSVSLNLRSLPDGPVRLTVDHSDAAGNSAVQGVLTLTKDSNRPVLTIRQPSPGTWINQANQSAFSLSGTCSENGRAVELSTPVTQSTSCSNGQWSLSLDLTSAGEGALTFTLNHSDAAGNAAQTLSPSFTKDAVAPTAAFSSPAAGATLTASDRGAFVLEGTCSENGIPVNLSGSRSAVAPCDSGQWSVTLDLSNVADGPVTFRAQQRDSAGNLSAESQRTFTLAGTLPQVAFTSPASLTWANLANAAAFQVSGSCTANGQTVTLSGDTSGTASCSQGKWGATLDLSSVSDGTFSLSLAQTDSAGNESISVSRDFRKDTEAPTVSIESPADGALIDSSAVSSFTLSGSCSEDGEPVSISGDLKGVATCSSSTWSFAPDLSKTPEGSVTVQVSQRDPAGNSSALAGISFTKKTLAARVAFTFPTAGSSIHTGNVSTFKVSGTCSEDGYNVELSGATTASVACAAGLWTTTLDLSAAPSGALTLLADHTGPSGNSATQASLNLVKDTSAPTVAITTPAAGANISSSAQSAFAVSGSCSEEGRSITLSGAASGTALCTSGVWSVSLDFSSAPDGSVSVTARHTDVAGNATTASRSFTKDATTPSLAITSPGASTSIHSGNVTAFRVAGICSDNTRTITFSGAATGSATCTSGAWSASLDFSLASQGTVTLNANMTDAAGNAATQASRSFVKDTVLPTVSISSPAVGSTISSTNQNAFTLSGACSENTRTVILSGDATGTATCSGSSWSATLDFSSAPNGTVSISVSHSDSSGNAATVATRSFSKDTTAPRLAFASPSAGAWINATQSTAFVLTGSCSESGRSVSLSGSASSTVSCLGGGWVATLALSSVSDGTLTFLADHSDAAGNAATQASITFKKDTVIPGLSITSPAAGTIISASNEAAFRVSGTCSEDGRRIVVTGDAQGSVLCSSGSWSLDLDFTAASNGGVSIAASHRDSAGNAISQSRTFTKQSTPASSPSIQIAGGAAVTRSSSVFLTLSAPAPVASMYITHASDCASGGSWESYSTTKADWVLDTTNGTATVYVRFNDGNGNLSACLSDTIVHDSLDPTISISSPASGTRIGSNGIGSVNVSGSCSEGGRSVVLTGSTSETVICAGGAWSATLDFSSAPDGTLSLQAGHSDAAGNTANPASISWIKDSQPPILAISSPSWGAWVTSANESAFPVSGTCSEEGESVQITAGAVTGSALCSGGSWATTLNLSSLSAGSLTITADLSDPAGNDANPDSRTVTKSTATPTVSINTGSAIRAATAGAYTVSGSCSESGRLVTITSPISTSTLCNGTTWSVSLNLISVADGSVTVTATHANPTGASATASRSFTKDTAVPWATITSPAALSYVTSSNTSSFSLSGSCSDNGQTITVTSPAGSATTTCSGSTWSRALNLTAVGSGTFTISVSTSNDSSGNASSSTSRSFIKDTTAPTLTISSPVAGSRISAAQVSAFSVSGTCGVNSRNVVISGSASATVTCTSGSWSALLDFTSAPEGSASITVNHSDAAGNAATPVNRSFTKDTTPPVLAITSPAQGSTLNATNASSVILAGTCDEEGATVAISGSATGSSTCSAGAFTTTLNLSGASDGALTLRADLSDASGNPAAQAQVSVVKDSVSPTLAIGSPSSGATIGISTLSAFAISGTCSENGRPVAISGDSSATVLCEGGAWSAGLNFSGSSDGTVTIQVNHSDLAGNSSAQQSRSFIKDTGTPTLTLSSPASGAWVGLASQSAFRISGTCSENNRTIWITGDVSESTLCSSGTWTKDLDVSALSDGTFTVTLDHGDASGNNAPSVSRSFRKDTDAPTLSQDTPAASTFIGASNFQAFEITGSCSENGRSVSLTGSVQATAPCTSGAWSVFLNFSTVADGAVNLQISHSDEAGNPAPPITLGFTKDTVLPELTILSPEPNTVVTASNESAFNVQGSCSEDGQTVSLAGGATDSTLCTEGAFQFALDLSGAPQSALTFNLNLSDAAGNAAPEQTLEVSKDTEPPSFTITSPDEGAFISASNALEFPVSGSCSEEGLNVSISGAASASVICVGGNWSTVLNLSSVPSGEVTLYFDHSDVAANSAPQQTRSLLKDVDGPQVAFTSPAALSVVPSGDLSALTVTGTCSEEGEAVVLSGDASGSTFCTSGEWTTLVDFSAASEGEVELRVDHSDRAGNAAPQRTRRFIKDTTTPTVAFTSPDSGAYVNLSNVRLRTITGTCSENGRPILISGSVSGTTTCLSGSWSIPLDFITEAEGALGLSADHIDAAGNSADSANLALVKDTTPPTVALSAPSGGEVFGIGSSQTITWSASDGSGISPNSIQLDYSTNRGVNYTSIATQQPHSGSYLWTIPNAPTEEGRVRITVSDAAGNSSQFSSLADFTIRAVTDPVKLAFTVQPATTTAGSTLASIRVAVQDSGGAVVTSATPTISLSIGTNPGSGTLSGTISAQAVQGVATFSNLSIERSGVGYTLIAQATGLTSAASRAFTIRGGAPTHLAFLAASPASAVARTCAGPFTVQVRDALGNPATTPGSTVVNLSESASGLGTFHTTSTCGLAVSSITIPYGSSQGVFYFRHDTAQSVPITAATAGITSASRTVVLQSIGTSVVRDGSSTVSGRAFAGASLSTSVTTTGPHRLLLASLTVNAPAGTTCSPGVSSSGLTFVLHQSRSLVGSDGSRVYSLLYRSVAATPLTQQVIQGNFGCSGSSLVSGTLVTVAYQGADVSGVQGSNGLAGWSSLPSQPDASGDTWTLDPLRSARAGAVFFTWNLAKEAVEPEVSGAALIESVSAYGYSIAVADTSPASTTVGQTHSISWTQVLSDNTLKVWDAIEILPVLQPTSIPTLDQAVTVNLGTSGLGTVRYNTAEANEALLLAILWKNSSPIIVAPTGTDTWTPVQTSTQASGLTLRIYRAFTTSLARNRAVNFQVPAVDAVAMVVSFRSASTSVIDATSVSNGSSANPSGNLTLLNPNALSISFLGRTTSSPATAGTGFLAVDSAIGSGLSLTLQSGLTNTNPAGTIVVPWNASATPWVKGDIGIRP